MPQATAIPASQAADTPSGVTVNGTPPQLAPRPSPKGKVLKPVRLDSRQEDRLRNRLFRVVCTEPWENHCRAEITRGAVPLRDDPKAGKEQQAVELRKAAVYPPGGLLTIMRRCGCCDRWYPPQGTRQACTRTIRHLPGGKAVREYGPVYTICEDCLYGRMSLAEMAQLPSAIGFDRRIPDAEVASHLGGEGYRQGRAKGRAKLRAPTARVDGEEFCRRRFLAADKREQNAPWLVYQHEVGEDGEMYESIYELRPAGE